MQKKDFRNLFLFTLLVLAVVFYVTYPNNMFGSVTDWGSQHTMLPEYFRTLFYQTGDLFPDFMMHLGAGQNIYNISYYGFLNPIVILSYCFPFIKMVDFLTLSNIIIILLSIYLCYYWLIKKEFSRPIVMISTLLFTCASPLIFHAHRHIMFISYMPFLLLGLLGIDRYFETKKRIMITISVLGMILTSYYYSIGGILVLVIYGIYSYLKQEKKLTLKQFLKDGVSFLWPIILGIGLSSILLIPTAYVIFNGRSGGREPIELSKLLLPHLDINALVYSSYSIGLSAVSILGLFHTFFTKKKEHIFIGTALTIIISIPIFMYALNGFLYVRAKVLIPFLPLFIFLIASLIHDIEHKKLNIKLETLTLILFAFFWSWRGYHNNWFFVDLAIIIFVLSAYYKWNKKYLYMVPMSLLAIGMVFVSNQQETYEKKDNYNRVFHQDKMELIEEAVQNDREFYRFNDLTDTLLTTNKVYHDRYYSTSLYSSTFHQPYKNFFYDTIGNADTYRNRLVTSSSSNIFFQTLMNVKYVIAKLGEQGIGYQLVKQKGEYGLYQNDHVYPLGYATNQIYQYDYWKQLEYPYNVELLMNGIVVKNKGNNEFTSQIKTIDIHNLESVKGLHVKKIKNGYQVKVKEEIDFDIPLTKPLDKNQILIIQFRLKKSQSCKEGDLSLAINHISNKLTCKQWMYHNGNYQFEYVISKEEKIDHLSIHMSKGTFEIVDINNYVLDYTTFQKQASKVDPLIIDMKNTIGDQIKGTIDVTQDGYFILSIPYDKALNITVDGKNQPFEIVNDVFIGFPIEKGQHKIEIEYKAPFKKIGMIMSSISLFLFGMMLYRDKKF